MKNQHIFKMDDFYQIGPTDKKTMLPIFKKTNIFSTFTCFEQFYSYLKKPTTKLYLINFHNKERVILFKNKDQVTDIRILFFKYDDDSLFIKHLINFFHPDYIAYNLIKEKPKPSLISTVRYELIIDVKTNVNFLDKELKKEYLKCLKRHPNILYRRAENKDLEKIEFFLKEWELRESLKQKRKISIENVRNYLRIFFSKKDVFIGIVLDKNKVIGLTGHSDSPINQSMIVSTFNMTARGYKELGVFTYIKQLQQIDKGGYKKVLIGGLESTKIGNKINKDKANFKMKFMKNGIIKKYYSEKIYSKIPSFLDTEEYLRDFWA
jgi:hypothetical protein